MLILKTIRITGVVGAEIDASPGSKAIIIKAGPKDVINISNLIIDGLNGGQTGIELDLFGSLTFTRSAVQNFSGDGIDIFEMSGKSFLIQDVVVSDNAGLGIVVVGVPGTLDHVSVIHNGAANCNITSCGSIRAAQGAAVVSIVDSTIVNNSSGIDLDDGSTIQLFHSFIPDGIVSTGGTALSAGNNFIKQTGLTEVGTH